MTPAQFRRIRHKYGLSLNGTARMLGVTLSTVKRWDREEIRIPTQIEIILALIERFPEVRDVMIPVGRARPGGHPGKR